MAFRPEVVAAVVAADVALDEELELATEAEEAEEELLLLLLLEALPAGAAELAEPAGAALPFKQESSVPAWMGTWEE